MNFQLVIIIASFAIVNVVYAAKCQGPDGNWYPYNSPQCDIVSQDNIDPRIELERAVQSREDKRLEYDADFQQQQIDLLRLEQQRKMMELDYAAQAQHRSLRLNERKFDLLESEVNADRQYTKEIQNDERIQRHVDNIRQTIDIRRDAEAAHLGVTRQQYDLIRRKY